MGAVVAAVGDAVTQPVFAVLLAGLLASALVRRRVTALHGYAFGVLAAHAVAGHFGWFSRYELYAYAAVLPVVEYLARRPLTALFAAHDGWRWAAAGAIVTMAVSAGYVGTTVRTSAGAANIYTQQAQMARFVSDHWRRPVAVNDLGLVADRGGQYVLDLWGLASQEARRARAADDGVGWMQRLTDEHGVELAMICDDPWFPEVPSSWTRVAVLSMDLPRVTSASRQVSFFATSARAAAELRPALRDFASTLPAHAALCFPAGATP
ncbi:hypothetical protein [Modestobacter altitudinis]|uniref:hypothetical protein n=1 Tax=Modestobacter altitudinis TaxID=2213158 RepID=UPI001487253F|nr:hypothetical protein [Modestobacter altitudinis]